MKRVIRAAVLCGVLATSGCALAVGGEKSFDPPVAVAGVSPGGTLRVGLPMTNSVDPAQAPIGLPGTISRLICEPLISIDPVDGSLKPVLADFWFIAEGGGAVTMKLKKGIRTADNREMKAQDVVFSLSRLVNPYWLSPFSDLLREPVEGAQAVFDGKASQSGPGARVSGIRVVDPYSIEIRLVTQTPAFLRALAHPAMGMMSREGTLEDVRNAEANPSCYGPYTLASPWRGERDLRLIRNPNYHDQSKAATIDGHGYPDVIDVVFYGDRPGQEATAAAYQGFLAGEVDVAPVPSAELNGAADVGTVAVGHPTALEALSFPVSVKPFDKRSARVALSRAIDRSALARATSAGAHEPALSFQLPRFHGPKTPDCAATTRSGSAATNAARELLAGTQFPLYFNDDFGHRAMLEEVVRQWKEALGVEAVLTPLPFDAIVSKATVGEGLDGPARVTAAQLTPIPEGQLTTWIGPPRSGAANLGRFTSRAVDELFTKNNDVVDDDDRRLVLQTVDEELCDEVPAIPLLDVRPAFVLRDGKVSLARQDTAISDYDGGLLLRELALTR